MISKVITGKSFAGCCRYVCRKEDHVKILHVNGVREANLKDMAADFEDNRRRLPNKHRAVFHGILSFHPSDKVTESRMTLIACQYLGRLTNDANKTVFLIKSSVNTVMAAVGTFVPGVGWVISGTYFLVDAMYPGGWEAIVDKLINYNYLDKMAEVEARERALTGHGFLNGMPKE